MARVVHFFKKGTKEMPYRNPEQKRKWEREHREQRNAQRRMRRLEGKNGFNARNPAPDPILAQKPKSGWKAILGLAIGLGIILVAAFSGISVPESGGPGKSPGSGSVRM